MIDKKQIQIDIWGNEIVPSATGVKKSSRKTKAEKQADMLPEKLGKAVRLPVPDFSDPNRKPTCLEADFPIAQINGLSSLEASSGATRKPIYQMSKWWARRQSSVFRSMLIAAATEAPEDPNEAAKRVWEHYYCNHQKAGSFKRLRVLDCFMGGGTTLVEGSRLGMQMTGVDLNPVAWFVTKNELACSDPARVKALFDHIEQEVKPQIRPFYTTTCPRGHKGRWIDVISGQPVSIDPIELPPEERYHYRWEGPEIVATFWAKHGLCTAKGCGHRTPIFNKLLINQKKLTTSFAELSCPSCGIYFHAEVGETRMAPGAERVILEDETPFTELSQEFAMLLNDYDKGNSNDTWERAKALQSMTQEELGLHCPKCGAFAGERLSDILKYHALPNLSATQRKKKEFGLKKKNVQMYLFIHPDWLKGVPGFDGERNLGGWAGASPDDTAAWFEKRLENLAVVEVRGTSLPEVVTIPDGIIIETGHGTVPRKAHFTCASCGRENNTLESVRITGYTAPAAPYAIQCHCPQCEEEGYNYNGRYFKPIEAADLKRLILAEFEWVDRKEKDLIDYWPNSELLPAYMTHKLNGGIPNWGYTHWWKMFNPRQLLVHTQLLKHITEAPEGEWPLDVREQALGAFQQYLRNHNMFCIWDISSDQLTPSMSNANFHPKLLPVENCVFLQRGRGNFYATFNPTLNGLEWAKKPWENVLSDELGSAKSLRIEIDDPIIPGNQPYCGSSTDLKILGNDQFDLVITDPPFGNNLFYADLADFFYVWLRIPLRKWYAGLPEAAYFEPERTPHSMEAVDNSVEHPDDREDYEKNIFIESKHLIQIRNKSGDETLAEKDLNPLYRPQPSSDFYSQTLSACWTEAGRRLKDGGIMAFTFHHNENQAWIDILKALFDAGYLLVATYPIRSDETKGDAGAFGSRKIEYDIIHVCRKRLSPPEPVSWARMRRWVKEEAMRLKVLLEHTHGKDLPESDLRVILRGKSLEFYSRHYGQVFTGDGQALDVREALLGINQLLDDLLEESSHKGVLRLPDSAEPASRLYLRLFRNNAEMDRDELHKTLMGTGISQGDLEARGWIRVVGRAVHVVPIKERFAFFTTPGRNRKVIKTDLDQAHFLIGAAFPKSGLKIEDELANPNFRVKKSADEILKWYAEADMDPDNRRAAETSAQLVEHWRQRRQVDTAARRQLTLFEQLEMNE